MSRNCESSEQGEGRDEKEKQMTEEGTKRKANDGGSFETLLLYRSRMSKNCESSEQGEGRDEKRNCEQYNGVFYKNEK